MEEELQNHVGREVLRKKKIQDEEEAAEAARRARRGRAMGVKIKQLKKQQSIEEGAFDPVGEAQSCLTAGSHQFFAGINWEEVEELGREVLPPSLETGGVTPPVSSEGGRTHVVAVDEDHVNVKENISTLVDLAAAPQDLEEVRGGQLDSGSSGLGGGASAGRGGAALLAPPPVPGAAPADPGTFGTGLSGRSTNQQQERPSLLTDTDIGGTNHASMQVGGRAAGGRAGGGAKSVQVGGRAGGGAKSVKSPAMPRESTGPRAGKMLRKSAQKG